MLFYDYFFISEEQERHPQQEHPEELMLLENTSFELYNDNKTRKWVLESDNFSIDRTTGKIQFSPVKIDVYDSTRENNVIYYLWAGSGDYYLDREFLQIEGDIEIHHGDNIIKTQKITWNQEDDTLQGRGGFVFETPRFVMTGREFKSDSSLEELEITGGDKRANFKFKEGTE